MIRLVFQRFSHLRLPLILGMIVFLNIIISSMACEIGELRDLKLNIPFHKGLELTDELTDPNSNSQNSQIIVIPPPNPHVLLVT